MSPLVPTRFLIRVTHPCFYIKDLPRESRSESDSLLDLPVSARLNSYAELDGNFQYADVRLAWNELGLAVQVTVAGKTRLPEGDSSRLLASDGMTLWLDTRDARASHRASRYCHQFHLLPAGGGPDKTEPTFVQSKINRALQDAPLCQSADIAFRCTIRDGGYCIEAFLPATVLTGFDPDQHPRMGVYYHVRDSELGDQFLAVSADFPIADDPSLWEPLELRKSGG